MSQFVRDHKRPIDFQYRITNDGLVRERVEHSIDSRGMHPWVAHPGDFDTMGGLPIRTIDDLDYTPHAPCGFFASRSFVIGLPLLLGRVTVHFTGRVPGG